MDFRLWLLICAISMALFGCVAVPYSDQFNNSTLTPQYTDASMLTCQGPNTNLPCYCFLCENKTSWWNSIPLLSSFFDTTLEGGNCSFTPCNATTFNSTLEGSSNVQVRVVAVGQGPSFTSADRSNRYCNYSLQIVTKWMKGVDGPPSVPNQSRAACWLQRNVLPVYIYYTNGSYIDTARSREIADEFNRTTGSFLSPIEGAGPVLLTTEAVFNSSNPAKIAQVKNQIIQYERCEKCLTVLAIKSNDTGALDSILGDATLYATSTGPKNMSQMVDIVGFGFRANDYENCSVGKIIGQNYIFSRYVLTRFQKPTIWLYVGASEGADVNGVCNWDAVKVHDFYQNLFAISHGMASSGIIGFSLYEFTDRMGPLPCNGVQGCDFGLRFIDGSQKHPEMNTWSSLCSYFGVAQYRSPLVFSRNGQGPQCDFMQNTKLFNKLTSEVNPEVSSLPSNTVIRAPRIPGIGCGEVCVSYHTIPDSQYGDTGEEIYDNTGDVFNPMHCAVQPDESEVHPDLEEYADDSDVSANYMRSLIQEKSAFNNYRIQCVNRSNMSCNPANLNITGINGICALANIPDFECPSECMLLSDGSQSKGCAFGLSQCMEYPGGYYATYLLPAPPEVRDCGGRLYNPFNPSMSICCGVKKYKRYLDMSKKFVNDNWLSIRDCPGGLRENDRDWLYYFMATFLLNTERYNSTTGTYAPAIDPLQNPNPLIISFENQRDAGGSCCAVSGCTENFVTYLRTISNYSAKIMSLYLDALSTCDSDCPGLPDGSLTSITVPVIPTETYNILSLSILGTGAGSVTAGGNICAENCSLSFIPSQNVTLVPEADADSLFAGWSGDCSGFGECTINMSSNMSATAVFNSAIRAADFSLQVSTAGTGSGTVTGAGISCPSACIASYPAGTTVILRAVPSGIAITSWPSATGAVRLISADLVTPSVFAGWSGDCAGTSTTCTLIMGSDKSVAATFNRTLPLPPPNDTTIDLPTAVT